MSLKEKNKVGHSGVVEWVLWWELNIDTNDFDIVERLIIPVHSRTLNRLNNILASYHFTEQRMFPVEPRRRYRRNKELTSVGVGSSVGHTDLERRIMTQGRMEFVFKLSAPATLTTCAISLGITGLYHETFDDTMENDAIVVAVLR